MAPPRYSSSSFRKSSSTSARIVSSRVRADTEGKVEEQEREHAEPERSAHPGVERRHHRRRRVHRAPDVHRHVDERHVGHAEDRHRGAQLLRARAAESPDQQVRHEDHPHQERRGEARVPLPPDAPGLARPERSGHQHDQAEHDGQLARPPPPAGRRPAGRWNRNSALAMPQTNAEQEHHHRRRHVEVEDLLDSPIAASRSGPQSGAPAISQKGAAANIAIATSTKGAG